MLHFSRIALYFSLLLLVISCGGNDERQPGIVQETEIEIPLDEIDDQVDDLAPDNNDPDNDNSDGNNSDNNDDTPSGTDEYVPDLTGIGVTFKIDAPSDTPANADIFISGDFESPAWSGGITADPLYRAELQDDGFYYLRLTFDESKMLTFKFTLGSWDNDESDIDGFAASNRVHTIDNDHILVNVTIGGWRNITQQVTVENYWSNGTIEYSSDTARPRITLNGADVLHLNTGDAYTELGAVGLDIDGTDISARINIEHSIVSEEGDYIVRYQLDNDAGVDALEVSRIVRVYDSTPSDLSLREVGTTGTHYGYAEHLPEDYGTVEGQQYPVIIFNHGYGLNAALLQRSRRSALNILVSNGGPTAAIQHAQWDNELPFIVLAPQRSQPTPINLDRLNAFVDYALHTYNIDTSRVYMSGWSQGGHVSLLYAVNYPDKIAAIAPIASGFFQGVPDDICAMRDIPTWAFHGQDDPTVSFDLSIAAIDAIGGCNGTGELKTTIFPGVNHASHQMVFDLTGLGLGNTVYDQYSESIYQWFLSH